MRLIIPISSKEKLLHIEAAEKELSHAGVIFHRVTNGNKEDPERLDGVHSNQAQREWILDPIYGASLED